MRQEPELSTHLWLVLYKAFQAIRQHDLLSIDATNLGLTDFGILEVLLHKGPLPVNTIAEKILLTSGSMTTAIDRLTQKNLVERLDHPTDRRVRLVQLTSEGRQLIEGIFEHHQQALKQATDGLSENEKNQLTTLLKKMGQYAAQTLPSRITKP